MRNLRAGSCRTDKKKHSLIFMQIKKILPVLLLTLLAGASLLAGCGESDSSTGNDAYSETTSGPKKAPIFSVPSINTQELISISALKGKPVVLNFAASWCGPCESEAPVLVNAYNKYKDEIVFIGMAVKDVEADQLAFAQKHGLTFPIGMDGNGKILYEYQRTMNLSLSGIPTTFFIDAEGNIANFFIGPLSESTMELKIQSIRKN